MSSLDKFRRSIEELEAEIAQLRRDHTKHYAELGVLYTELAALKAKADELQELADEQGERLDDIEARQRELADVISKMRTTESKSEFAALAGLQKVLRMALSGQPHCENEWCCKPQFMRDGITPSHIVGSHSQGGGCVTPRTYGNGRAGTAEKSGRRFTLA